MSLISGTANKPILPAGWGAVNIGSNQSALDTTIASWDYNYDPSVKKWANAKDTRGSLWVWIPRYTYKILGENSVDIKFSNGTNDDTANSFKKHKSFTFGTVELQGIWVQKYQAYSDSGIPGSKPSQSTWRSITVNDIFNACLNLKNNITTSASSVDSHMMKNIEFGAVGMLACAIGQAKPKINGDTSFRAGFTTNGTVNTSGSLDTTGETSTTGNLTGVFDMVGCAYQYVASYVNNGHDNLSTYCQSLVNADAKYKDVFPKSSNDDEAANYAAASGLSDGMMINETSTSGTTDSSWTNWAGNKSQSCFPFSSSPVFLRGGNYNSSNAGLAAFLSNNGNNYGSCGFRACFVNLNSAPLISGTDTDFGDKNAPFSKVYQVSDADGDSLTVVEKINGVIKRTLNPAQQNTDIEFTIDMSTWNELTIGQQSTMTIEATDTKNSTSIRTYTFKKVNAVPSAPGAITKPEAGETIKGTYDIVWTESTDSDSGDTLTYKVYYSSDGGTTKQLIKDGISQLTCQIDVSLIPEGSTYQIFVCANDGKVDGPFVSSGIFTIVHNMAPQALSALLPIHTARTILNPEFVAAVGTDPEGDNQYFRIQVAEDVNFANLILDKETAVKNLLTYNQSSIEADTVGFTEVGSTIQKVTTQHDDGASSLSVTTSGTVANEGIKLSSFDILGGYPYSASAKVRGAGFIRLVIEELDANDNILRSTSCDPITLDGTSWQQMKVTAVTGKDSKKIRIAVLTSSVIGATFFCDNFMVVNGRDIPEQFILGGTYGSGTNSSLDGWEIYNGTIWTNMPPEGAPTGTQKVKYKLNISLEMNKSYYWRMAAKDVTGAYGTWTLPRIIRVGDTLQFKLKQPIETSAEAQRFLCIGYQNIASDGSVSADMKIEACNNAFDTVPTWEDITQAYVNKEVYIFTNKSKTAEKWGIDIKVTIKAHDSLGTIEDLGLGFSFD